MAREDVSSVGNIFETLRILNVSEITAEVFQVSLPGSLTLLTP